MDPKSQNVEKIPDDWENCPILVRFFKVFSIIHKVQFGKKWSYENFENTVEKVLTGSKHSQKNKIHVKHTVFSIGLKRVVFRKIDQNPNHPELLHILLRG